MGSAAETKISIAQLRFCSIASYERLRVLEAVFDGVDHVFVKDAFVAVRP
jgi:hypothetical protein